MISPYPIGLSLYKMIINFNEAMAADGGTLNTVGPGWLSGAPRNIPVGSTPNRAIEIVKINLSPESCSVS